jgi:16S rRNA (cytosine967-C5)-methyltransferase
MIAPARLAAYQALREVATGRTSLASAVASARVRLSDERDRALSTDLATGTLRWRNEADHLIAVFAGRPVARLDPEVADILRLSSYQLLHLQRVPAAAVVNDAVQMVRAAGKASAASFVNAVLRSLVRQRGRLPLPQAPRDEAGTGPVQTRARVEEFVTIALSHPRWLAARWIDRYGTDAAIAWARFNNTTPSITLRANRLKASRDELAARLESAGVSVRATRFAPDGLAVTRGNPLATPLAGLGLFVVQDEAAQLVAAFVDARPGETVLDACASPGGKTTALAADMDDRGLLVSADVRPRRMRLLRRAAALSGASIVRLVQLDARQQLPFQPAVFDRVLVDAPCSGLGVIRREPDIRWRRAEDELPAFADCELSMLERAAAAVRPGGTLVYATCSSEPEENEAVVDRFLTGQPDFTVEDPLHDSSPAPAGLAPVMDDRGHLRTLPHLHALEAFFAARLRRRSSPR